MQGRLRYFHFLKSLAQVSINIFKKETSLSVREQTGTEIKQ